MIAIENVTMRFGRLAAVDGVSLHVGAGERVALWGVNGAGKSTLLRCVLGLLRFQGRITVGGHDVQREGKQARRLIGYVPQDASFYDDMRTGEAVAYFARLRGVGVRDVGDVLARVGLAGQQRTRVRDLSGGMKKRLAVALAGLGDPPVLILDEVTSGLDAVGREEFLSLLTAQGGTGRTMLVASHRVEEVVRLAGRVVCLERGRVAGDMSAGAFAPERGTTLRLRVAEPVLDQAIETLRARGYAAWGNGLGVVVALPDGAKAGPIRVLTEARIVVEDFELTPAAPRPEADTREAKS